MKINQLPLFSVTYPFPPGLVDNPPAFYLVTAISLRMVERNMSVFASFTAGNVKRKGNTENGQESLRSVDSGPQSEQPITSDETLDPSKKTALEEVNNFSFSSFFNLCLWVFFLLWYFFLFLWIMHRGRLWSSVFNCF